MKRIFISGPYTKGNVELNVKKAMDIANELIDLGFAPYCAHLTHFLELNHHQPYEKWLEIDIKFLEICDAIIRIPGESSGADKEITFAKNIGIPIYYTIDQLKEKCMS